MPFVIQGDFSKEFLESMGYKPFVPPLVEACKDPVIPLVGIKNSLYPKIEGFDKENDDASKSFL